MSKILDLSLEIQNNMICQESFPRATYLPYCQHSDFRGHDAGPMNPDEPISWALNYMAFVEHTGTHIDGPLHFNPDGAGIDQIPLDTFFGKAVCFDLQHIEERGEITPKDLEEAEKKSGVKVDGHIVLMATGFHDRHYPNERIIFCNATVTTESVKWLADRGTKIFGCEGPSADVMDEGIYPSHIACRNYGVTHYEWLVNLPKLIGKGEFQFFGVPLKLQGGTGSPVRAFAIYED